MEIHHRVGQAGLIGWREKVANVVAPRAPISDDTVRTALGAVFFALSVYYVVQTIVRAVRNNR